MVAMRHRENLARAAIVERGGEARVDAEPLADLLVMAVDVIGAAADDAVDVADLEARVGDGVAHRLDQQIEARHARHLAEPAVAGADDGADVAQLAGWFESWAALVVCSADHFASSRMRATTSGGAA